MRDVIPDRRSGQPSMCQVLNVPAEVVRCWALVVNADPCQEAYILVDGSTTGPSSGRPVCVMLAACCGLRQLGREGISN